MIIAKYLARVLLQRLTLTDGHLPEGPGDVTSGDKLKQLGGECRLSPDVVSIDVWTCPFLIIAIASWPTSVRRAVQKPPKPSPEWIRRLIPWWSCSTMLFRYLTWRHRERRQSAPLTFISTTAFGYAGFLSTVIVRGFTE
jgi:hypothetical protein